MSDMDKRTNDNNMDTCPSCGLVRQCLPCEAKSLALEQVEAERDDLKKENERLTEINNGPCLEHVDILLKLGEVREALEHCRNRPHEHNPSKDFTITRCEVIDRGITLLTELIEGKEK